MPVKLTPLWAAVMNAERVRIVRDLQPQAGHETPTPPDEIVFEIDVKSLDEIMADKPGRSFASAGGGRRSSMEYASDPVADASRALLRDAIARLESHRQDGDFDRLAVFADPSALGEWRKLVPPALAATVIKEVAANHLKLSPHDLRKLLQTQLSGPPA